MTFCPQNKFTGYPSYGLHIMGRVDSPRTLVQFLTPELTARVDGCQKMHPSWRAVNSGSGNRALGAWSLYSRDCRRRGVTNEYRMLCGVVAACAVDLAFVIDNSGSIRDNDPPGGNNWQLILNFVKSIIHEIIIAPHATRVAVVDFG